MGAIRDVILFKQTHLLMGLISMAVAAFIMNLVLSQFKLGFAEQPIAHTMHIWNFAGMVLAGLAFTLAGGCPGRQLFLSGEGDGDAAVFVIGMIVVLALLIILDLLVLVLVLHRWNNCTFHWLSILSINRFYNERKFLGGLKMNNIIDAKGLSCLNLLY